MFRLCFQLQPPIIDIINILNQLRRGAAPLTRPKLFRKKLFTFAVRHRSTARSVFLENLDHLRLPNKDKQTKYNRSDMCYMEFMEQGNINGDTNVYMSCFQRGETCCNPLINLSKKMCVFNLLSPLQRLLTCYMTFNFVFCNYD